MSMYGREALRQFREQQALPPEQRQLSILEQIPADTPMDDAAITVWNGTRWIAWDKWLATAPLAREEGPLKPATKQARHEAPGLPEKGSAGQEELW